MKGNDKMIIPIILLERDEARVAVKEIVSGEIKGFGNGFIVSKEAHIISVAHVLNTDYISYAFFNNAFYKIDIIKRIYSDIDEENIDLALGKILGIETIDNFSPYLFEKVNVDDDIYIMGYSKKIGENQNIEFKLEKMDSKCDFTEYMYKEGKNIKMKNYFSFFLYNNFIWGYSGSPIFNSRNSLVGVLKGGTPYGEFTQTQALHIHLVEEIIKQELDQH